MPNDLTITASAPILAIPPVAPDRGSAPAASAFVPLGYAPSFPNPAMHIDPVLDLVVIEFHNAAGQITDSTPTPRQLNAYRLTMRIGDAAHPMPQELPDR
jgi:hypothetical protein